MAIVRWLAAIIIVFVVIGALGFVKFGQIQAAIAMGESFPEPSASVETTRAETITHSPTIQVIGQLRAPSVLDIRNEYAGPITYVGFEPGALVKHGQVLLRQDVSLEQANLKAAKARADLASKRLARQVSLRKDNRTSQSEVDIAQADLAVAQAEVQNISAMIDKKTISAPFDGRISLTPFYVGQFLDVNTTIGTLVGNESIIWVDFSIPQTSPQLAIGDEIKVANNGNWFSAKVIAKNAAVNMASRQQGYRAQLGNNDGVFSHNQFVNIQIASTASRVVSVPSIAVTRNHFGEFVYELIKDDQGQWRASPHKVELGEKVADQQLVLAGLEGGEYIATHGAFKLYEGILVYPAQADSSDMSGSR